MEARTEENHEKAEMLVNSLLKDTYFAGFSYDPFFTLRLNRMIEAEFNAHKLPFNIDISILRS
jgi:hypothetical protein